MDILLVKELVQEIEAGNIDGVKRCIEKGADVNYRDPLSFFGHTPLHLAADNGNVKMCELFVKANADPNVQNKNGQTPLQLAAENGNVKLCELLVKANADPNVQNKNGETPLHLAAKNSDEKTCELLVKANADPNVQTKNGETSLHWAAKNSKTKVCELLVKVNADPNVQNKNGETPVHLAAENGNENICELLVKANADPNVQNKNGETPLHRACWAYRTNRGNGILMIELLLRAGGETNIMNNKKENPFEYLDKVGLSNAKKIEQSISLCRKLMAEGSKPVDVVKVYLCGDPAAGKTTIKNSLTSKQRLFGLFGWSRGKQPDSDNYERTPGINVEKLSIGSESYIFWDCAGQMEYSLTHGMFLGVRQALFVVVYDIVNLSKGFMTTTEYWLPFIKAVKSGAEKPRVIIVGTHYDAIQDKQSGI